MRALVYFLTIPIIAVMLAMGIFWYAHPAREVVIGEDRTAAIGETIKNAPPPIKPEKPLAERIKDAYDRSSNIKGLYMTADVANDAGAPATRLRESIIHLAQTTEINGIVIDVKEVCGPDYNEKHLQALLQELHEKNIWAIARIVSFKDASQINAHPDWYLTRSNYKSARDECVRKSYLRATAPDGQKSSANFWRDNKGGYWMDPASTGAREYIISVGKKMVDMGFDELQFDYVRFPSDGDVAIANYPAWDKKTPKHVVMKSFFEQVHRELKSYKPEVILSADLFGYAATSAGDVGIGQRLEDIGESFDYLSFMVYPSHYYNGLALPADPTHGLPALNLNRSQARQHPDQIVGRAMIAAREFLDKKITALTQATSTTGNQQATIIMSAPTQSSENQNQTHRVMLRPWLEDFFHEADKHAGRPYGREKVRPQIDAAESTDNHGWLLWNASNVYTEEALREK